MYFKLDKYSRYIGGITKLYMVSFYVYVRFSSVYENDPLSIFLNT